MKLYVNGVLTSSLAATGSLSTFSTDLKFGNNTTANDFIAGTIDDTRIYDHALTPAEIQIIYQNLTAINEKTSPQVTVYPNPVSDYLIISADDNKFESVKFELYDALGNVVFLSDKMINGINVASYPNGAYFLKVSTEKGLSYQKIILTR